LAKKLSRANAAMESIIAATSSGAPGLFNALYRSSLSAVLLTWQLYSRWSEALDSAASPDLLAREASILQVSQVTGR
jgi:hypothetical protein